MHLGLGSTLLKGLGCAFSEDSGPGLDPSPGPVYKLCPIAELFSSENAFAMPIKAINKSIKFVKSLRNQQLVSFPLSFVDIHKNKELKSKDHKIIKK